MGIKGFEKEQQNKYEHCRVFTATIQLQNGHFKSLIGGNLSVPSLGDLFTWMQEKNWGIDLPAS